MERGISVTKRFWIALSKALLMIRRAGGILVNHKVIRLGFIMALALLTSVGYQIRVRANDRLVHLQLAESETEPDQRKLNISSSPLLSATPVLTESARLPLVRQDPTITPLPSPTSTPIPQAGWLAYLNQFRTQTGLIPLTENSSWSTGGYLHSRYMVKNDYVGHSEDPGNPWYTLEGLAAAQNGNVFVSSWINSTDERAIDFWMTAPFHAISMIDPQLQVTGFSSYRESIDLWKMGATLDVRRGLSSIPPGTTFPIVFPADGSATRLVAYYGGEFPDPLTSCPGYTPPTGPPIMVQLGSGEVTPDVTSHNFTRNGIPVESCIYDETSYLNANPGMQNTGRIILGNRDAVVIMPRQPLVPGDSYMASVTSADTTATWTFSVVPGINEAELIPSYRFHLGSGPIQD